MSLKTRYSDYDAIAKLYNENWVPVEGQIFFPTLDKLILQYLPAGAHILDLCCGTGQTSQRMLTKGYQVTRLDGSEAMLNYARQNAPGGEFILDDARFFKLPPIFHGVISMGALSHILTLEELTKVFHNVYASLLENGLFVFDLYLEEGAQSSWNGSLDGGAIKDDYAYGSRWSYNPDGKMGTIDITIFRLLESGYWQRSNLTVPLKPYSPVEVQLALEEIGFTEVSIYNTEHDLGEREATGRTYFVGRKPPSK